MIERYHEGSRELQDRFDTRRLAVRRPRAGDTLFPNCPRYIHRMALVERSSYVPRAGIVTPIPEWKRSELAAGVLPKDDPAS